MFDASWHYLDRDDSATLVTEAHSPDLVLSTVISDGNVHVIEQIECVGFVVEDIHNTSVFGCSLAVHIAAHRKAYRTVLLVALNGVAPGDWHVVYDPMVLIVLEHAFHQTIEALDI